MERKEVGTIGVVVSGFYNRVMSAGEESEMIVVDGVESSSVAVALVAAYIAWGNPTTRV